MNKNIQGDFQICISVPLSNSSLLRAVFHKFLLGSSLRTFLDISLIKGEQNAYLKIKCNKKATRTVI